MDITNDKLLSNYCMILVHGAGLGSYIWEDIFKNFPLKKINIDFPFREQPKKSILLKHSDYLEDCMDQVVIEPNTKYFLITHSIGSIIGLHIADYLKDRLCGFVSIGGIIPKIGRNFFSSWPLPYKVFYAIGMHVLGTKPPDKVIASDLCSDLTEDQKKEVVQKYTPEAMSLYSLEAPGIETLKNVNRYYIQLSKDNAMPIKMQQVMANQLKSTHVSLMESGHLPMISHPRELEKNLIDFMIRSTFLDK